MIEPSLFLYIKYYQYSITSLDYEIDEDINMYDIILNSSVNIENEVIKDMTLQEYIQEFKNILPPTKANIFIDRYYKMTEEILKDYNYMLHVIELINLELEEETNIDHVDKLKYIKNKNDLIIKK